MYLHLGLKNWRSIEEAEITVAPFTVIVGRNSTGKSNIVDALVFASEVARDAATAVTRRGGIASIRRWSPSRPFDVSIDVSVAATRKDLESRKDLAQHRFTLRSGKEAAWYFARERISFLRGGAIRGALKRERANVTMEGPQPWLPGFDFDVVPETTSAMALVRQFRLGHGLRVVLPLVRALRPVPELMRLPQTPTESGRLVENASNITTALHQMSAAQNRNVVQAMARIIPGLRSVTAVAAGRYLTLSFKQEHAADRIAEFAATEMSEGALRALAIVVAAQQMMADELLIIEEPEVNLHPGAADIVYDVLHRASEKGAVLVTTHSPELLDRAKDDEILVCSYERGVTQIGPLASAQRTIVRDGLFTVAELMRSEELRREGAEPKVVKDAS